jgi:hypothetical protein
MRLAPATSAAAPSPTARPPPGRGGLPPEGGDFFLATNGDFYLAIDTVGVNRMVEPKLGSLAPVRSSSERRLLIEEPAAVVVAFRRSALDSVQEQRGQRQH